MRGHRIGRAEYDARYAEPDFERKTLANSEPRPVFLRQRDMRRPLVDDWRDMETRERRRLIEDVFLARQRQEQNTLTPVTTSERKTGLEPATLSLARKCSTRLSYFRMSSRF